MKKSYLITIALTFAVTGWMLAGRFVSTPETERLIDESYSSVRAAQAELAEILLEIKHTEIRAPFDGILELLLVEIGDYVEANSETASIADNNPLLVSAHIAQQNIGQFTLGDTADAGREHIVLAAAKATDKS